MVLGVSMPERETGRLDVFARYVVHPELSGKNGVATHPFGPEETPDEASS
jgi:hypothetical protein